MLKLPVTCHHNSLWPPFWILLLETTNWPWTQKGPHKWVSHGRKPGKGGITWYCSHLNQLIYDIHLWQPSWILLMETSTRPWTQKGHQKWVSYGRKPGKVGMTKYISLNKLYDIDIFCWQPSWILLIATIVWPLNIKITTEMGFSWQKTYKKRYYTIL